MAAPRGNIKKVVFEKNHTKNKKQIKKSKTPLSKGKWRIDAYVASDTPRVSYLPREDVG